MSLPSIALTPLSGTFPFSAKDIPLPSGTKLVLGSTERTTSRDAARLHSTTNGWFPPILTEDTSIPGVSPLALSSSHAEIWYNGGQVYIQDLDSAFGTFLNGVRITSATVLKTGDIITLGSHIARNDNTPAYITDLHLSPIIAKVSLTGITS